MFATPSSAAKLALGVVAGLVVLKVVVGVISGSISILAQAVDSFLDLFAVIITFLAVGMATKPADEEHPFGHGKVEYIAAMMQGVLILAAGGFVIYSAVQRIITGVVVELTEAGIVTMLVSIIASILLSRHLLRVSREADSAALRANAQNITTDVYSAAAVLAGLIAIRFSGLNILDPIIAILVALFILKVAYDVLKGSFSGLIDVRLPEAEESIIRTSIMEHASAFVGFHDLRTRKGGNQRYINFHLVIPKDVSVGQAHQTCDQIEQGIKTRLPNSSVTIHIEPGNGE